MKYRNIYTKYIPIPVYSGKKYCLQQLTNNKKLISLLPKFWYLIIKTLKCTSNFNI